MSHAELLLIGAGGHARVLLDALLLTGARVAGLLDADPALAGTRLLGYPILGDDEALRERQPATFDLVNAIGSTKSLARRRAVYVELRARGYRFAGVLHPAATVSRHAAVDEGAQIMAGAVIQACARIGANSIVNTGATVDHDCQVGAHVHVAPGATLSGNVQVGDETHIGSGATVIQGVRIGARCVVAAGAVVLENVPDDSMVAGVPARKARN